MSNEDNMKLMINIIRNKVSLTTKCIEIDDNEIIKLIKQYIHNYMSRHTKEYIENDVYSFNDISNYVTDDIIKNFKKDNVIELYRYKNVNNKITNNSKCKIYNFEDYYSYKIYDNIQRSMDDIDQNLNTIVDIVSDLLYLMDDRIYVSKKVLQDSVEKTSAVLILDNLEKDRFYNRIIKYVLYDYIEIPKDIISK